MEKKDTNAVVGVYETHDAAESAVKELHKAGFDMKKLSVLGKDYHTEEHVVGYYNTGDRMKAWGKVGAFWGSIWGILMGAGFFIIPGLGPIAVAGPLVGTIIGALEGAIFLGGASAIGGALASLGIPKDSIIKYESSLKADKFVLICHGTAEEMQQAQGILKNTAATGVDFHEGLAGQLGQLPG